MEYPSRRWTCFADAGAMPAWNANSVERLDLFLNGRSGAVAQSLLWTEAGIEHSIELRFRSRYWNWNCGRVAVVDRARCSGMGRSSQLVESARLAACVHGINDGGRDIFSARDRRVNRRQTADDSETYCACT